MYRVVGFGEVDKEQEAETVAVRVEECVDVGDVGGDASGAKKGVLCFVDDVLQWLLDRVSNDAGAEPVKSGWDSDRAEV